MNVAAFTELTGPDGLEVIEAPEPEAGPGEAVISVEACSLNRHDLWILEGDSATVEGIELPFVSGLDVAGVVQETGEGVSTVEAGDRVVLCPNETCGTCRYCREGPETLCESFSLYHGGLAEAAAVPADRLVTLPDAVETTVAAALPTAYMTAYQMLQRANAEPADLIFIPGVTGGVGVASVQLADVLGARTIGTSSSSKKLGRLTELGLDHAIEATDPELIRERVQTIGTADVVLDHMGGEYTDIGLSVVRRGGPVVVCGRTAGSHSEITIPSLFVSQKRIIGSKMATQTALEKLVGLVAAGELTPEIDDLYTLEETRAAFEAMQNRESVGKLVVTT